MTNIIFCAKGVPCTKEDLLQTRKKLDKQTNFFVLCEKVQAVNLLQGIPKNSGISFLVFSDGTGEDAMVSSCIKSIENIQPIVLIRSNCNYASFENIEMLVQKIESGKDIALFRQAQKGGKVRAWFSKTYKRLCEIFFGFKFFEGNVSLIAFSSRAHKILKETPVTMMTKINRWVGVETEYVEKQVLPKNKPIKTPISYVASTMVWAGAFLAFLFCLIFFAVSGTLGIVSFLLYLGGVLLTGALFAYRLLVLVSHKHIGSVKSKSLSQFERRDL